MQGGVEKAAICAIFRLLPILCAEGSHKAGLWIIAVFYFPASRMVGVALERLCGNILSS